MLSGRQVAISHHSSPVRGFAEAVFDGGKADKAVPVGEGSRLYELNIWAMALGLGNERTVTVQAELEARSARREH